MLPLDNFISLILTVTHMLMTPKSKSIALASWYEGKQRTRLSSRVAMRISWSPLSGLKGVNPPLQFGCPRSGAAAKRSYPTSKVRGSGRECQAATAQERPRRATPRPRSGAAAGSARLRQPRSSREELSQPPFPSPIKWERLPQLLNE